MPDQITEACLVVRDTREPGDALEKRSCRRGIGYDFARSCVVVFFKVIPHRIASRLQPPVLQHALSGTPDFPFRTLDVSAHHLSDSKGKVVLLDLWGTWCIQCIAEMPTVDELYEHYRGALDVEFLIVSRLDSPSAVRAYARRNHLNLPFYVTEDPEIPASMYLA